MAAFLQTILLDDFFRLPHCRPRWRSSLNWGFGGRASRACRGPEKRAVSRGAVWRRKAGEGGFGGSDKTDRLADRQTGKTNRQMDRSSRSWHRQRVNMRRVDRPRHDLLPTTYSKMFDCKRSRLTSLQPRPLFPPWPPGIPLAPLPLELENRGPLSAAAAPGQGQGRLEGHSGQLPPYIKGL